jgi:hypothetical protein
MGVPEEQFGPRRAATRRQGTPGVFKNADNLSSGLILYPTNQVYASDLK